jgi:hypothetical protein
MGPIPDLFQCRVPVAGAELRHLDRADLEHTLTPKIGANSWIQKYIEHGAWVERSIRQAKTCRWEHSRDGQWFAGRGGRDTPIYTNQVFREQDLVEFALGVEGEPHAALAGELDYPAFSFKELKDGTDCEVLWDFEIVLWPDNDDEGRKMAADVAARLTPVARSVRVAQIPKELPEAGDIVDAVRDLNWSRGHVEQLINEAQPIVQAAETSTELVVRESHLPVAVGAPDTPLMPFPELWHKLVLTRDRRPKGVLANTNIVLAEDPKWEGVLAFNEFTLGVDVRKPPPWECASKIPFEWTDQEDRLATHWLQCHGIHVSVDTAAQAVEPPLISWTVNTT